ncbi:MAG: putative rane protein [Proteobacteria bacterium]|nr:putative rane protein [Pseudomonadota bacterium]
MSEGWTDWLSYRPSDFLMFSPRIYWRLFESLNLAFWPLQAGIVLAGLAWLGWVWRDGGTPGRSAARSALSALALGWALTGWAFLWHRLAPIHWLAGYIAPLFLLQAAALLALAVHGAVQGHHDRLRRVAGLALLLWALLLHPLLAGLSGRPWTQAEFGGLAADPTVIATLGLLLLLRGPRGPMRALWALPLAWCMLSAATLWTMGSAQGWVPCAVLLLAGLAARRGRHAAFAEGGPRGHGRAW